MLIVQVSVINNALNVLLEENFILTNVYSNAQLEHMINKIYAINVIINVNNVQEILHPNVRLVMQDIIYWEVIVKIVAQVYSLLIQLHFNVNHVNRGVYNAKLHLIHASCVT